ncbi:MAG: molybdopterin converting factor subunit 1 [Sphingomonadaceae bacterium]|nr:molybdopterin converting factor subunit 1 [Sphingomonadaceae bacterium]
MALEILYFAWVREAIGSDAETVEPPDGVETIGDLIGWLAGRGEGYAEALGEPGRLRAAIDQVFASMETPLGEAREVAIFPPVTGG